MRFWVLLLRIVQSWLCSSVMLARVDLEFGSIGGVLGEERLG